ncbi:ADOP family duplicated permease [Cellvibrio sp. NN19]|uniref:ADOP family duplicated permease n=1 Tax=Cellvibrio chitinivorans TaxID=3102792 RepID=UPI002B405096|nr:ADOP family duplicated permease [Cellvibrio sp. NN19]
MSLLLDIKYTLRILLKTPGFTALTIAVMTIGLGVSIFMMSVVNAFVFRPLDFKDGERLMFINRLVDKRVQQTLLHDYQKIKSESQSFELVVAFGSETAVLSDGVKSIRYQGIYAGDDFFEYTGVVPLLGRTLTNNDQQIGSLPVVVIGYDLWQNYFDADSAIIGKTVQINREKVEVVGVMPKGYVFPFNNQIWLPLKKDAHQFSLKNSPLIRLLAKAKPGISAAEAELELQTIYANSTDLRINPQQNLSARIDLYKRELSRNNINIFYLMLSSGFFVLALSCINVGNLLLARANMRSKEIAIRVALGAQRTRLISQMMWESLFICGIGGLLAILFAGWGLDAVTQFFMKRSTDGIPFFAVMSLRMEDVINALAVIVITALVTGFIPAWKASGRNFNAVLKDAAKTSLGKTAGFISKILVTVEIGLSCALMVIAGIISILIYHAVAEGYGMNINNFLTARVNPPPSVYPQGPAQTGYYNRLLMDISNISGVEKATLMSHVPTEFLPASGIQPEGQEFPTSAFPQAHLVQVYPNTFETLSIPLLEGRLLDERDNENSPKVAVISDEFANKIWPEESPIGKRIRIASSIQTMPDNWMTVVGVVPQLMQGSLFGSEQEPTVYVPFAQMPRDAMAIVLKTRSDPNLFQQPLARVLHNIDPNLPMYRFATLTAQAENNRVLLDLMERIFFLFAICSLVMAVSGIYGVMANHIEQRTQELGIRRALGSPDTRILLLFSRQSALQLITGFALGLPLAYFMSRSFIKTIGAENQLHLLAYILVPIIITVAVFVATWIPLQRILRMEPALALRYE